MFENTLDLTQGVSSATRTSYDHYHDNCRPNGSTEGQPHHAGPGGGPGPQTHDRRLHHHNYYGRAAGCCGARHRTRYHHNPGPRASIFAACRGNPNHQYSGPTGTKEDLMNCKNCEQPMQLSHSFGVIRAYRCPDCGLMCEHNFLENKVMWTQVAETQEVPHQQPHGFRPL